MNSEKLLDAIGMVGEDLILEAKARQKKHITWKHWTAIEASLVLVITTTALLLLRDIPGVEEQNKLQIIPITQTVQATIPCQGSTADPSASYSTMSDCSIESGICATMRAIEILPDTYFIYSDWNRIPFRLVHMETLRTLRGEKMVEEFYYLLPAKYAADLTKYEALVIENMHQYGYENSVLFNSTTGEAEVMDLLLFGSPYSSLQCIIPFHNGIFTSELWIATEAWLEYSEYWREDLLEDDEDDIVRQNWTLEQVEASIIEKYKDSLVYVYVHSLAGIKSSDAQALLLYAQDLNNGLYIPKTESIMHLSPEIQQCYRRYIGNYPTNETIQIWVDSAKHSVARFTESDLSNLPDLASGIHAVAKALDENQIHPSHIADYETRELIKNGLFGWYAKTDSGVCGVIRVSWQYDGDPGTYDLYDDKYFIIKADSDICQEIDRDALLELQGTQDFIFTGEYDKNGKLPIG